MELSPPPRREGLEELFRAFVKRQRDDDRGNRLATNLDGNISAGGGVLRRDVAHANRLADGGTDCAAGQLADGRALAQNGIPGARNAPTAQLDAHTLARQPLLLLRQQRIAPD